MFDTTGWPTELTDLLNDEGTELDADDSQLRSQYNETFDQLETLVIKKEDSGDGDDGKDGDDDSPGFGLLVALMAVGISAAVVGRRRHG